MLVAVSHIDRLPRARSGSRPMTSTTPPARMPVRDTRRINADVYCLDGLKKFAGMTQAELAPILMELAVLGQKGLPVNDPTRRQYPLRTLAGEFTALHLVWLLHVGIKQLDPRRVPVLALSRSTRPPWRCIGTRAHLPRRKPGSRAVRQSSGSAHA